MKTSKALVLSITATTVLIATFFYPRKEQTTMDNNTEYSTDLQPVNTQNPAPPTPPNIVVNNQNIKSTIFDWYDQASKKRSIEEPDGPFSINIFKPIKIDSDSLTIGIQTAAIPDRIYVQQFSSIDQSNSPTNATYSQFSPNDHTSDIEFLHDKNQFTIPINKNQPYITITIEYTNTAFFENPSDEVPLKIHSNYQIRVE